MNKNMRLIGISIIVIAIILIVTAIALTFVYIQKNQGKVEEEPGLEYFITKSQNKLGISKSNGNVILNNSYDSIIRNQDAVYLKATEASYIYFLSTGTYVTLDGKETDVNCLTDLEDNLLPYFVLSYGQDESSKIYKLYDLQGNKYGNRDFASEQDIYNFLNISKTYVAKAPSNELKVKYSTITGLDYPTELKKSKYIVSTKEDNKTGKKGIVDENDAVIIPLEYDEITLIGNSKAAVKLVKNGVNYLANGAGKMVEIEPGFEIVSFEGNCFIQKKGSNVSKIYDSNLNVVITGIYTYPNDFKFFKTMNSKYFLSIVKSKNITTIYNLTDKTEKEVENLKIDYLITYTTTSKIENLIYQKDLNNYILNLSDFTSYKLKSVANLINPLDNGTKYLIQKEEK